MSVWREVPGYPGYEASSDGQVRSVDRAVPHPKYGVQNRRGRVLAQHTNSGYLTVHVSIDGVRSRPGVHKLVCLAFHGVPKSTQVVRHLDGNSQRNHADNLAWGTYSDNAQDRVRHGTDAQARKTHCPKGHPYDQKNTYNRPDKKGRMCRTCMTEHDKGRSR